MMVFFDTEFTCFDTDPNGYPALISAGFVAQSGSEFYAELTDTWDTSMCSHFVLNNVLPLLDCGEARMPERMFAEKLREWIEAFGESIALFSDAPYYDWSWIGETLNKYGWPQNLAKRPGTIQLGPPRQKKFDIAIDDFWMLHGEQRHHALIDARSLQFAWRRSNQ